MRIRDGRSCPPFAQIGNCCFGSCLQVLRSCPVSCTWFHEISLILQETPFSALPDLNKGLALALARSSDSLAKPCSFSSEWTSLALAQKPQFLCTGTPVTARAPGFASLSWKPLEMGHVLPPGPGSHELLYPDLCRGLPWNLLTIWPLGSTSQISDVADLATA